MARLIKDARTHTRAKTLRADMTESERAMWRLLRDRRLTGLKFRRQVPLGGYVVDFACFTPRLIIELDGDEHRHADRAAFDAQRTETLQSAGFRVLRFWNGDILTQREAILTTICTAAQQSEL